MNSDRFLKHSLDFHIDVQLFPELCGTENGMQTGVPTGTPTGPTVIEPKLAPNASTY